MRDFVLQDIGAAPAAAPLADPPAHYVAPSGLEAIDVIEAFGLGFHLGNAVKYVLRAGRKGDRAEDLRKARWHIDREIAREESGEADIKIDDVDVPRT